MQLELPLTLKTALESGNCVLFLGAGIAKHFSNKNGISAPTAAELSSELADQFSIKEADVLPLSQIAAIVEIRHGRSALIAFLQKRLAEIEPDEALQWLFTLRWKAIFTTNYDHGIERGYELIGRPQQNPISISATSDLIEPNKNFDVPIYHLHGSLYGAKDPNIVITDDDYALFNRRRSMLFEILKIQFANSPFLYIGYSNSDPNWKQLLAELKQELGPDKLHASFRISPGTDKIQSEILRSSNILDLNCTYQEFYENASGLIDISKTDAARYHNQDLLPPELRPYYEKNPVSLSRLLMSWEFVNYSNFHAQPNTDDFFRGDKPNWPLIGSDHKFERDIEDDIYNELLDFATSTSDKPRAITILGSAGYGTTTLLMSLAAKLTRDQAGFVFMHKGNGPLIEGDIEFASQLIDQEKLFFVVDNASKNIDGIANVLSRLKDLNRPGLLLIGSRLNEWRQLPKKPPVKEYLIEPLSDPEIHRLLDLLQKHGRLGALEALDKEIQFATVKQKHNKELLVMLREVTEGKSFDAIIESEFQGISSVFAKNLYLMVCGFHQHGVSVRDKLLAKMLNTPLEKMYEETEAQTEGVIRYEPLTEEGEDYVARARHRIIATIVWERCTTQTDKDTIMNNALDALNLNYYLDKQAFDSFVRSDRSVDQLGSFEGKVRFFETAAKKDPESPYVKQHYARMLLRESKHNLALSQINNAIELAPANRVLHHTKGKVLLELASSAESPELARRWLSQSEESFKHCLILFPKDDYSFQGLAQLYFRWAQRAPSEDESTLYLSKAEEIISRGMKEAKEKEALWIESAKIQEYLGNEPSKLASLERAVKDSPGSILPRFLLGRAYRLGGKFEAAMNTLRPVISDHSDEYRCFVEYALASSAHKQHYQEAIAVLNLSTLYGYSDPKFIAVLGGMLFMTGKLEQAGKVFQETFRNSFSSKEMQIVFFEPWIPDDYPSPIRLTGKVIVEKPGYVLIESPGFHPFLCPGSKFKGEILKFGMRVEFSPGFSARGAIALNPIVVV